MINYRPASVLVAVLLCTGSGSATADPVAGPPASGSTLYRSEPLLTADVSLAFGYAGSQLNDGFEGGLLVGTGVVGLPLWSGWNVEVEIAEIVSASRTDYGGFAHAYFGTPEYAAGFVFGATEANGSKFDGSTLTAGVESAAFFPAATVLAQFLYSRGSGDAKDTWSIGSEARWYPNPNTKLSGRLAYRGADPAWLAGGVAEHRLSRTAFSLFAAGSYCSCDAWDFVVGTRLIFDPNGRTLQEHDNAVPFVVGRPISG